MVHHGDASEAGVPASGGVGVRRDGNIEVFARSEEAGMTVGVEVGSRGRLTK